MRQPTDTTQHREGRPQGPGGFTLVEILIAMLVLAIGILGALTMQFAALNGAVVSQDLTNATDIAQRVKHIMSVEAQQWRDGDIETSISDSGAYDSDWEVSSILRAAADNQNQWVRVFDAPVDVRLSTRGNQRYCTYVRGNYLENQRETGTHRDETMFRAHIAVVYPSGSGSIGDECPGTGSDSIQDMEPGRGAEESGSLEREGYRVVHLGTVITQRGHLSGAS